MKHLCRRAAHRGPDVPLDTCQLMMPDVSPTQPTDPWKLFHSWKWKHSGHITELEMRSASTTIRWRARSSSPPRTRFVLFIDNESSIAGGRQLQPCSARRAGLWTRKRTRNPADAGSRKQHATSKSSTCAKRSSRHCQCRAQLALAPSLAVSSPEGILTTIACAVACALYWYKDAVTAFST